MNKAMIPWALAALVLTVLALPAAAAAEAVELESKTLKVTVDSEFPRIIQYKNKADGTTLDGQTEPVSTVELNGKTEPCGITFKKRGADTAEYRLEFPRAKVEASLGVTVGANVVELGMTEIRENGTVKVKTIAFPGNAWLTLRSSQPDAFIASVHYSTVEAPVCAVFRETFGPLASLKPGADTASYFFCSAGALAAGIASNHIYDVQRAAFVIAEKDGVKTCAAQNPEWLYRHVPGETVGLPWV